MTFKSNQDFTEIYDSFNLKKTIEKQQPEIYNCYSCQAIDSIKNISGVNVCTKCGIIKGSEISQDMECQYSGLAAGDNSSTAHSGLSNNKLLFQSNFSTKIVGKNTSYSLKQINNVWDSLDYKERTLLKIFKNISDNCRIGGIPNNAISYSHVLYKKAHEKQRTKKYKSSRGGNLLGLIGASIYFSCKAYGINRSPSEIAKICGIDTSEISFGIKLFFNLMHDELNLNQNRTTYQDFLERFASHLNLDDHELHIVEEICQQIYEYGILDGNKPSTVASVAIYFASNLYDFNLERKEISEQCDTTEPTLIKNYKLLMDYVDKLVI